MNQHQWSWPLVWYQPWQLAEPEQSFPGGDEADEPCVGWCGSNGTSPLDLRTTLKATEKDGNSCCPSADVADGSDNRDDETSTRTNPSPTMDIENQSSTEAPLTSDSRMAARGSGCPRSSESSDSSDPAPCWYRCTSCPFSSCDVLQFYVHLLTHEVVDQKGARLRRPYDCSVCGYHDDAAEKVKEHILNMAKDGRHHRACVQPPLSTIVLKCADYYAMEVVKQDGGHPTSPSKDARKSTHAARKHKPSDKIHGRNVASVSVNSQLSANLPDGTPHTETQPISVTYKCCRCGARSLAKRVIAHHLLRCHGVDKMDTFCCTSCKTRYTQASSLWWHIQKIHLGELAEAVVICDGHRPPRGVEGLHEDDSRADDERLEAALKTEGNVEGKANREESAVEVVRDNGASARHEVEKTTGFSQDRLRSLLLHGTAAASGQQGSKRTSQKSQTTAVRPPETKNRKRPYNCTKCPTSFCGVVAWKMHKRLHGAPFPYKCTQCDYAVRNRGNLSWHLKLHAKHNSTRQG